MTKRTQRSHTVRPPTPSTGVQGFANYAGWAGFVLLTIVGLGLVATEITPFIPAAATMTGKLVLVAAGWFVLYRQGFNNRAWLVFWAARTLLELGRAVSSLFEHSPYFTGVGVLNDARFFIAYGLITWALARHASTHRASDPLIFLDGVTTGICTTLVVWAVAMPPLPAGGNALYDLALRWVYPALGSVLIFFAFRALQHTTHRGLTWILATHITVWIAGDALFVRQLIQGATTPQPLSKVLWSAASATAVLVIAVPARRRTRPLHRNRRYRLTWQGTVAVLIAGLTLPVALLARHATGQPLDLVPAVTGAVLLYLVVAIRLVVLSRRFQHQRHILEHQATHDRLTGLGNREALHDIGMHATSRGVGIVLLDLDNFKDVNDTLGHDSGDEVLQATSTRIRDVVGDSGACLVRLGGDEFAAVYEDIDETAHEHIIDLARQLTQALNTSVKLASGRTINGSASVGVAFGSSDDELGNVMSNADIALYHAKAAGKAQFQVYTPELHRAMQRRLELRQALPDAILHNQFALVYQPVVNLDTDVIVGWEALARWDHPTHGRLGPGEFIELAEETGDINSLGDWVLATACATTMRLNPHAHGPFVSVNISPVQVEDPAIAQRILSSLRASKLQPHRLLVELTESTAITDFSKVQYLFQTLRHAGVRVALDDFGAGFSSVRRLQVLDFEVLKLDRSLIVDLSDTGKRVFDGVCALGHSAGYVMICEGIETLSQLELVTSNGGRYAQGYLLHRPYEADVLAARVAASAPPT